MAATCVVKKAELRSRRNAEISIAEGIKPGCPSGSLVRRCLSDGNGARQTTSPSYRNGRCTRPQSCTARADENERSTLWATPGAEKSVARRSGEALVASFRAGCLHDSDPA